MIHSPLEGWLESVHGWALTTGRQYYSEGVFAVIPTPWEDCINRLEMDTLTLDLI